jgi:hypothetical protein
MGAGLGRTIADTPNGSKASAGGTTIHNDRGSHDERRLTARRTSRPAPEVATAPAPTVKVKIDEIELFAVVDNYAALQDGFADRIEDLNVTLTEIDAAAGMTRGQVQRLLQKLDADDFRPSATRHCSQFARKTLGQTLKGTGLALALIVDDERFAPVKAKMVQRARPSRPPKVAFRNGQGERQDAASGKTRRAKQCP